MKIDLEQFHQIYLQESAEHVASLEADLLALRSAPHDPDILNSIFRAAHSIKGGASSLGLTQLMRFTHALESLLDCLRETEIAVTIDLIHSLLHAVDILRAMLASGRAGEMTEQALLLVQHFESLVVGAGKRDAKEWSTKESALPDSGETSDFFMQPQKEDAQGLPAAHTAYATVAPEMSYLRVPTHKVDQLIDLVGELVIAQAVTAQRITDNESTRQPKLRDAVQALQRSTRELHERVMAIRMMPVGPLFQRYTRVLYDIGQATGKQIRLQTSGEQTEIDKSMLELLSDPLTHLIRNAADHGIESPAARFTAGKPEEGVISLNAFHRAGRIVIEVSDDGAGIDAERVRAKAIDRGLIKAEADLTPDQLRMLIFEPGFSTRETVSDLSGRGVGMDIVKRSVQQLSGNVCVGSVPGQGSTVSIQLPLTLAILEGLLVRVADQTLVVPLSVVVEVLSLRTYAICRIAERAEVIQVREESIPVLRLEEFLRLNESNATVTETHDQKVRSKNHPEQDLRLVVIVDVGHRKVGFAVDQLLGQQQVVVKSLEKNLHRVEGLMGATILGDGRVAPILDVGVLSELNLFALGQPAGLPNRRQWNPVTVANLSLATGHSQRAL